MLINIEDANKTEMILESEQCLQLVKEYIIDCQDMADMAAGERNSIKSRIKFLDDRRKLITKPLDDVKKSVMDLFREPIEILQKSENIISKSLLTWISKCEEEKRIEQLRLQEIARKEREELYKEIEAKKLENERLQKQIEDDRKRAIESGNKKKAEELAAENKRYKDECDDHYRDQIILAQTIVAIAPLEPEKIKGITNKTVWRYKVTDIKKVPRDYLVENEKMLSGMATATKGSLKIEGIEFYPETQLAKTRR